MSTVKTTTLSTLDGTYTVPAETLARGACRAWCNFNGTGTVAIRASFNVSSITDNGTGDYTVNFTNAMEDADYSCVGSSAENDSGFFSNHHGFQLGKTAPTTTSIRVNTANSTGVATDHFRICAAIFR